MYYWAASCAIAALVFGILGFSGSINKRYAVTARFLLALFLILFIIFLLVSWGFWGPQR